MAKTYTLWKVQDLVKRVQLEEEHAAEQYNKFDDEVGMGEVRAYNKVLRIIKDIFGQDAVEKKEGKDGQTRD